MLSIKLLVKREQIYNGMVDANIHTAYIAMDTQLKYTWLTAFAMDYKRFIEKWSELFCFMREERIEEINEHAKKAARNMMPELEEYAKKNSNMPKR